MCRFPPKVRFTALQSGEIDLLSRYTSWTMSRDSGLGINFVGVLYHDGQGFMVRKASGVTRARQLSGASVCTATGTTTELNVADFFRRHNMKLRIVAFEKASEVIAAYDAGRCDVYTSARLLLTRPAHQVEEPRPTPRPAHHNIQGAGGASGPPGRRSVLQSGKMGAERAAGGGGASGHPPEPRP